jgi:hypothetical protein
MEPGVKRIKGQHADEENEGRSRLFKVQICITCVLQDWAVFRC